MEQSVDDLEGRVQIDGDQVGGDKIGGDKVGGDKITINVYNITNYPAIVYENSQVKTRQKGKQRIELTVPLDLDSLSEEKVKAAITAAQYALAGELGLQPNEVEILRVTLGSMTILIRVPAGPAIEFVKKRDYMTNVPPLFRQVGIEKEIKYVFIVEDTDLSSADLHGARLTAAYLSEADLRRANLSGANLRGANLREARLAEADLPWDDLSWADLSGADLRGANLSWADLNSTNLFGADLRKANLSWADLTRTILAQANLSRANLSGANLSRANLSEADLNRADLTKTNLSWANLDGANLSGADLRWAVVDLDQLPQVTLDKKTTMPDGTKYKPPAKKPKGNP